METRVDTEPRPNNSTPFEWLWPHCAGLGEGNVKSTPAPASAAGCTTPCSRRVGRRDIRVDSSRNMEPETGVVCLKRGAGKTQNIEACRWGAERQECKRRHAFVGYAEGCVLGTEEDVRECQ
eukprot:TRINITY_DN5729_c2_g1_i1.p2 TRINITY_DN5729_c2_g1~~TRINITY_DN5729_c2_g1_i1.p2  ORF type:complete len:122 (-),score=2.86 TRINITY_DN5729_c2_g1_i1:377-742(-)